MGTKANALNLSMGKPHAKKPALSSFAKKKGATVLSVPKSKNRRATVYQASDKMFIAAYLRHAFGYPISAKDLDIEYTQWAEIRAAFWETAVNANRVLSMAGKPSLKAAKEDSHALDC
jgi:hypothetical protein